MPQSFLISGFKISIESRLAVLSFQTLSLRVGMLGLDLLLRRFHSELVKLFDKVISIILSAMVFMKILFISDFIVIIIILFIFSIIILRFHQGGLWRLRNQLAEIDRKLFVIIDSRNSSIQFLSL